MLAFTILDISKKPAGVESVTIPDDIEALAYPEVIVGAASVQVVKPFASDELPDWWSSGRQGA